MRLIRVLFQIFELHEISDQQQLGEAHCRGGCGVVPARSAVLQESLGG